MFNSNVVQDFNMDENREDFYFNQIDELSDYEDAVPAVDFQFGGTQDFNDDFNDDPADFEMGTEEANVIQVEKGRMQKVERNVMRMVANTAVNQDQNMFQYFDTIPGRNWAGSEFWKGRSLKGLSQD